MAIVLKYGNPGIVAGAGFAAGFGKRQRDREEDALKQWQDQQRQLQQMRFQAWQADLGRQQQFALQQAGFKQQKDLQEAGQGFQALQGQWQRAFQADQAALGRDFQLGQQGKEFEFRKGEADLNRKFQESQAREQREGLLDVHTLDGIRKGELELPPEAQRKMDQLEAARVEALKLDPVQQEEFQQRYEKERRSLLRMAKPQQKMALDEDFAANTYEKDGTLYERTDGGWQVLREAPKDTTAEDQKKKDDAIFKQYQKNKEEVSTETGKPLYADDDAAMKAAIKSYESDESVRRRYLTQPTAPGPLTQPAAPAPPAAPLPYTTTSRALGSAGFTQGRSTLSGPATQVQPQVVQSPTAATATAAAPVAPAGGGLLSGLLGGVVGGYGSDRGLSAVTPTPAATPAISAASEAAFNTKWATLQPGQSLRGPDGRIYVKRGQ